jgi:sialidase-1
MLLAAAGDSDPSIHLRASLDNARIQFERGKTGRVAFLGGSITVATGWRNGVEELLRTRFPETAFEFVNAGISSTDTTMGPMRLRTDVLNKGRIDILFVDFAVNDQHNDRTEEESIRGMEGIIRQTLAANTNACIVLQYFADPIKLEHIRAGNTPPITGRHDRVAQHYGVIAIDQALEVATRIDRGDFTWEDFGGLHPAPFGHQVYVDTITRLFDRAWAKPLTDDAAAIAHPMPTAPLDPLHYGRGRYVPINAVTVKSGWTRDPKWVPTDEASTRSGFAEVPALTADAPGAELSLSFEGTAVGIVVAAGPDVGILEYQIDDGPPQRLDQFTQWSPRLHIPWAYTLAADLSPGPHRLTLRTTDAKHQESTGHACRIIHFYAN